MTRLLHLSPARYPASAACALILLIMDAGVCAAASASTPCCERSGVVTRVATEGVKTHVGYESTGLTIDFHRDDVLMSNWSIGLAGFGSGESAKRVRCIHPSRDRNRIEYDYGDVTEWFVERGDAIEHGFTIFGAEGTHDLVGEFQLDLRIDSILTPILKHDAIEFVDQSGTALITYDELHVYDAAGNERCAAMLLDGIHIQLTFDVTDAVYPIIVDPLISTPIWTAFGGQTDSWYGVSVSTAGDIDGDGYSDILVGASQFDVTGTDEGCVYVHYGSQTGPAISPGTTLVGSQNDAEFGTSVATAGDVNGDGYSDVIVGSWLFSDAFSEEGRVDVFLGTPIGLLLTPAWTIFGGQNQALLGRSVACAGDVNRDGYSDVIVGADGYSNGHSREGYAAVYLGSPTGLATTPAWTIEGEQVDAFLGYSVGTAGDINGDGYSDVVIGVYYYDDVLPDQGRVLVFEGSATGLASTAAGTLQVDQADCHFGVSVGTAGDTNGDGYSDVIVGAHLYDNGEINEGAAFLYLGSPAGLSTTPDWIGEPDVDGAFYGYDVRSCGDVNGDGFGDFAVGAPTHNNNGALAGASFLYLGGPIHPIPQNPIDGGQDDGTGISNGNAGDVNGDGLSDVIIGSFGHSNAVPNEGMARVFAGKTGLPSTGATWSVNGETVDARLGTVAYAGDINGDGFADVIVAAPSHSQSAALQGKFDVYLGSDVGLELTPVLSVEGENGGMQLGRACAAAGDVNGDGFADVIVGAPSFTRTGGDNEGLVRLFHGSSTGPDGSFDWEFQGELEDGFLGSAVAGAGDVNGDGYADVIVGIPGASNAVEAPPHGRVYAFYGSPNGLAVSPHWIVSSDECCTLFGSRVAGAGDLNGDGYSDIVIGEPEKNARRGRVHVYFGSAAGLIAPSAIVLDGAVDNGRFGNGLAGAGDVNQDGYDDLLVAAPEKNSGVVYVFYGSASGIAETPDAQILGQLSDGMFGSAVASAGDVNADGYFDVIVGSPFGGMGLANSGLAHLFLGGPTGLSEEPDWTIVGTGIGNNLGMHVAGSGDVNGDGFADLLVGEPARTTAVFREGTVHSFLGSGYGVSVNPRQRRSDFSGPVSAAGLTGSTDGVVLWMAPRSPIGRTDAVVEWQIAAHGTPLENGDIYQSGTLNTLNQSTLTSISGLAANQLYRWRARCRYAKASSPSVQYSRWYQPRDPGPSRMSFRTAPTTDEPPSIITEPAPINGCFGNFQALIVVATGSPPMSYQWHKDGAQIPGATGPSLVFGRLGTVDEGDYFVQVSNVAGTVTSSPVAVAVERHRVCSITGPDRVVEQDQVLLIADVDAPGSPALRWLRDGMELSDSGNVSGAQSNMLVINSVGIADAGRYSLRVTSAECEVESSAYSLEVLPVADQNWDDRFHQVGADSPVNAMITWDDGEGEAVYVGGSFGRIGRVFCPLVAKWDGDQFKTLGSGLGTDATTTGGVEDLAIFDDGCGEALVAAGAFNGAVTTQDPIGNIAKWDGAEWLPLGSGIHFATAPGFPPVGQQRVYAIASFDAGTGEELYAGGSFPVAGRESTPWIAKWNGESWSRVGGPAEELDGAVTSLHVFDAGGGPLLFVAGSFANAGVTAVDGLAAWNGDMWIPIGTGLSNSLFGSAGVTDMLSFDDGSGAALYVAGTFDQFNGMPLNPVARWTGSGFVSVGALEGLFIQVERLGVHDFGSGPTLFASGFFAANGVFYSLARWNGIEWEYLPAAQSGIIASFASFEHQSQSNLMVGGSINGSESVLLGNIAALQANDELNPLPGEGVDGEIRALCPTSGALGTGVVASGRFLFTGSDVASNIARWDGTDWHSLGTGLQYSGNTIPGRAMVVHDDGGGERLYVAGDFHTAGGVSCQNIASWDGVTWSSVGEGLNNDVLALAAFDDGSGPALYAGGEFTMSAGQTVAYVAKWDGASWTPVGAGMNGPVACLAVHDDGSGARLFAGGRFTQADGQVTNHVAAWNGSTWQQVGGGFGGFSSALMRVNALASFDDGAGSQLYAGGRFLNAGGQQTRYIARWDGAGWSEVGGGVEGELSPALDTQVTSLAVVLDGDTPSLFVGGTFITSGTISSRGIARWDGAQWSQLGSGFLGTLEIVYAMAGSETAEESALFIGGVFSRIGTTRSLGIGRWELGGMSALAGDMNCDGVVDFDDLDPFATALAAPEDYAAAYPQCDIDRADMDGNSSVNSADIAGFMNHLLSP